MSAGYSRDMQVTYHVACCSCSQTKLAKFQSDVKSQTVAGLQVCISTGGGVHLIALATAVQQLVAKLPPGRHLCPACHPLE
jgi:hypothetical protein